jgi:ferredoxin-NADP reductase
MAMKTFTIALEWVKTIAPGVKHFACKRVDGEPFPYIPGQFITLHFHVDGQDYRRSYSLAAPPEESDLLEFAASYIEGGIASEVFFNIEPGYEFTASGPFGRLILRDEQPKRIILAATGTGVTPYRAMLPSIKERLQHQDTEYVLLLGVQHRDDLLYGEEFAAFAAAHDKFSFRAQYSREQLSNALPYEHEGYVQTAFADLQPDPEGDVVYLCGNPKMIDDAYAILQDKGFDVSNVRREKYISAK